MFYALDTILLMGEGVADLALPERLVSGKDSLCAYAKASIHQLLHSLRAFSSKPSSLAFFNIRSASSV